MELKLQNQRLILSTLDSTKAGLVQEYYWRNEEFFKPWLPTYSEAFFSKSYIFDRLEEQWKAMRERQFLRFFIFHSTDPHQSHILGDISYSNILRGAFNSCFLGYKIDAQNNGLGIASEALALSNQFLFKEWGLHRIEANIMPQNKASMRVVEKLGFQQEGLAKKFLKIDGQWQDHFRFALLNPDA